MAKFMACFWNQRFYTFFGSTALTQQTSYVPLSFSDYIFQIEMGTCGLISLKKLIRRTEQKLFICSVIEKNVF